MRKGKKIDCLDSSSIYNKLMKSKNNKKIMDNNDVRIGDNMAIDSKTNVIYKLNKSF